jgi:hypothetical protein
MFLVVCTSAVLLIFDSHRRRLSLQQQSKTFASFILSPIVDKPEPALQLGITAAQNRERTIKERRDNNCDDGFFPFHVKAPSVRLCNVNHSLLESRDIVSGLSGLCYQASLQNFASGGEEQKWYY